MSIWAQPLREGNRLYEYDSLAMVRAALVSASDFQGLALPSVTEVPLGGMPPSGVPDDVMTACGPQRPTTTLVLPGRNVAETIGTIL